MRPAKKALPIERVHTGARCVNWQYGIMLGSRKQESARQPPCRHIGWNGGKSGLHRAGRQVTPGGREPMESATENTPPKRARRAGKGEKVR
jgi:hypothetical protein